jgi:AraC-like DNA-binding protein
MTELEVEERLREVLEGKGSSEDDTSRVSELYAVGLRSRSKSCVALATLLRADRLRAINDPRTTLTQLDSLLRTSADLLSGSLIALLYEIKASEYLKLGSAIQALDCSLRAIKMPEKSVDVETRCVRWVAACQLLVGETIEAIAQLENVCIGRMAQHVSPTTRNGILLQAAFARWVAAVAKDGRLHSFWTTAAAHTVDVDSASHHLAMMRKWLDAVGNPEFGTDGYFFLSLYRALLLAAENDYRPALSALRTVIRELAAKDSYLAQRLTIETVMVARWSGEIELAGSLLDAIPPLDSRKAGLLAGMVLYERLSVSLLTGDTVVIAELASKLLTEHSRLYVGVGALLQGAFDFAPEPEVAIPKAIADLRDRLRSEQSIAVPLSKLLDDFGLSRRAVELGFQKHLGRSPAEFRLAARLEIAKNLLKETTLAVQEIAERVGFSSASALGAAYRRVYAKSPSDERLT